jgi:hypothetical protein
MRYGFRTIVLPVLMAGGFILAGSHPGFSGDLGTAKIAVRSSTAISSKDAQRAIQVDPKPLPNQPAETIPTVSLLDAMKKGQVKVSATGIGDGRMTLSVTNRTHDKLRVVLSPGLIASGASGQFGGMGGMGGGMGGMGGMGMGGMGMGGMGGGMGGMGGGMGGMGGGMGGMGRGGMGGGMGMGGGTMPPMMGMMMLGRLIMTLVGDKDSWDMTSLMSGMMGGGMMGGGMMGGMGGMGMGGMGGMGGGMGMMGGMGGGFRSVPPTGLPSATLNPRQTRELPTRLVSLQGPNAEGRAILPAKGESLKIGRFDQISGDRWARAALHRVALEKAPPSVAQLVMWHVYHGFSWDTLGQITKSWANDYERTLAKDYVNRLRQSSSPDELAPGETGAVCFALTGPSDESRTAELHEALLKTPMLGLIPRDGVPETPEGPALAVRIQLDKNLARVQFSSSSADFNSWERVGKLEIPLLDDGKPRTPAAIADALADGLLDRLVAVTLVRGKRVNSKVTYTLRIDNASPLILNGLALTGTGVDVSKTPPSALAGLTLPPHRSVAMPASSSMVERLQLKAGVKPVAADFSAL